MDRDYIKRFKAGQRKLSARNLNKIVDAADRRLQAVPPLRVTRTQRADIISLSSHGRWWTGRIDPSDQPSDYSDYRYFVRKCRPTNSDAVSDEALNWEDKPWPDSDIYTVCNLAEVNPDSLATPYHNVPSDTRVLVYELEDKSLPPQWRKVMSVAPLPMPSDANVWVLMASDGNISWTKVSDFACP